MTSPVSSTRFAMKPEELSSSGAFQRKSSGFRNWISSAPNSPHPPTANRYHLYVSLACPWACRTLIVKRLKGLDSVIGHTVVDWFLDRRVGWVFTESKAHCEKDPIHGFERLHQVYELAQPGYDGNVTVPVLFDVVRDTIVNNESSEIIRMLNSEFNLLCGTPEQAALDLYPEVLRATIDSVNEWVYATINNGVYRAGLAATQRAYQEAVTDLFVSLDRCEAILAKQRYMAGAVLTEADVRLFVTLIRFDVAYYAHFKCNLHQLRDYPNLFRYMLDLYQMPAIRPTVDFEHIKHGYYCMEHLNPSGIVPVGPLQDLEQPHDRDRFKSTV